MAQSNSQRTVWQVPEGFVRVESQVPDVIVFAPEPKAKQTDQATSYNCPNCGAAVAYDVPAGGIACEYCGYVAPVKTQQLGQSAQEFEFTLETLSQSDRGWGTERQMIHCDSCGGELTIPSGEISTTCPFCASNKVNLTVCHDETLRPRFLIPFKLTPEQIQRLTLDWLGKGWFHPDELAASTIVQHFNGIYLPFWTFDAKVDADWKAQVGYEKTERHYNAHEKRWETHTRIVWRWEDGHVQVSVDDNLITGSNPSQISHHILKGLHPFDLGDLVAYKPDFLAGWQAQAYQTTLTDAWEQGKTAIREQAKAACRQDIGSAHVRNFNMIADFSDESWRYILLPVYLTSYRYQDKVYQIMVNGQNGKVAGQKPVAWWKVWLVIAAMLAPGAILGLIGILTILIGGIGMIPFAIGIILFVIGLVFSIILLNKARQSEAK